MKVRFLIEQWSDQNIIEMTQEEYDNFAAMNLWEQEEFIQSKSNYDFETVNIELHEIKG